MRNEIAPLAERHWLTFARAVADERDDIVGCHCGFRADLDSDCGWGDSVVEHLLETGYNAGRLS